MKKSKIGINLLFINPKIPGGSVVYALKLIEQLSRLDKINEYVIYINKESRNLNFKLGVNFQLKVLKFNYSSVYLRYFWEQFILPFHLIHDRIELLHSLGYVTPIISPVKKVVSILDINYRGHAKNMKPIKRLLLGLMVNISARVSQKIITISEFSKDQIKYYLKVKENKIIVTLLSGSSDFEIENNFNSEVIKSKYSIDSDYIVCFSGSSPHKNIIKLLESIDVILLARKDLKLVLIGFVTEKIFEAIENLGLEKYVICTGFVPDKDIKPLITYAKLFVFPSTYEGFGIPILDAQACGVPVISSNAGSLPEVGGSKTYYFDPHSNESIYETVSEVINLIDQNKIKDLIDFGLKNRKNFSWEKTALETLNVYQNILT